MWKKSLYSIALLTPDGCAMRILFNLLDTLPVCQDFNRQGCTRPTCRFVHIREGCGLQVVGSRVVVCRDAAAGACRRAACRYYHIPVQLPPALRPPNLTTTLTLHPPPHPYPLTSHFSSPIQKSSIQPRIAALSISIAPLAHSGMADVMSSCKDRCVCRLASHKLCCIHNISDVLSRRVGRRRRGGRAGAGLPAASGETAQAGVKSCLSALLT
ncbi:hypothetical protein MSG28_002131 [Choristoneura fumiferana]|uniref:Uncharacterized protein n=1 Tax=Choristoneura fumiferana TaxID=7141 RepID=A0ACC0JUM3_CHOFU|nr:hypothetical protein MSG28_002131 [Choristoneura fumiferana]